MNEKYISASGATNHTIAFCFNRSPGLYCDPSDSLNIVTCPTGDLIPCEDNRFCASVGRVPDCYQCEASFDLAEYCGRRGPGTHCAPWWSGSSGVWSCPSGKEIKCPWGSACQRINKELAICMLDPEEAIIDGGNRFCPPLTVTSTSACYTTSRSSTSTQMTATTVSTSTQSSLSTITSVISLSIVGTSTSTETSFVADPIISAFAIITNTYTSSTTNTLTSSLHSTSTVTLTSLETPSLACYGTELVTKLCLAPGTTEIITLCNQIVPQISCLSSGTNNIGQSYCLSYTSAFIPGTTTVTFTTTSTLITTTISSTTSTGTDSSTSTFIPCSNSFSIYGCLTDTICPNGECTEITVCDSYSLSLSQCFPTTTTSLNCSSSFSLYGCIVDTVCPNNTCTAITACESYSLSLSLCYNNQCDVSTSTTSCYSESTSLSPIGDQTIQICTATSNTFIDCCSTFISSATSTWTTVSDIITFTSSLTGTFWTNTCPLCPLSTSMLQTCVYLSSSIPEFGTITTFTACTSTLGTIVTPCP